MDFFWENIKKEKNWLKNHAPKKEMNQLIFFRFDKTKNCVQGYHQAFGVFPIRKSNFQKAIKGIEWRKQRKQKDIDFNLKEWVIYTIFDDYTSGKKSGKF